MTGNAFDPRDGPGTLRLEMQADDVVSLCLVGEFDMGNAASIERESEQVLRARNHLIVDLSEATFIDSHVIHALFGVARRASSSRRIAVLQLGTAAIVETVIQVSEIERVLPRATSRSDALRAIRRLEADFDQPR